jgi:parallel beta-helix repeat protein
MISRILLSLSLLTCGLLAGPTNTVTSLGDSGPGTLRAAIQSANQTNGSTIIFATNGTISLLTPLPSVSRNVIIDATTAAGYTSNPLVQVDFAGNAGVFFAPGSSGSTLAGLALVGAANSAVTIQASNVTVRDNFIGVEMDGLTNGNGGDGVKLLSPSAKCTIGSTNIVTSIDYWNATNTSDFPYPVQGWQGIRNYQTNEGQFLICGTSGTNGLLYIGPMDGVGGTNLLLRPSFDQSAVSIYGPDNLTNGDVRLVGSYKTAVTNTNYYNHGFVWDGTTDDLSNNGGTFRTIDYVGARNYKAKYQYVHSTMGGLAVGNADSAVKVLSNQITPVGPGIAFICNLSSTNANLTNASDFVTMPLPRGAKSITAYGIWDNGVVTDTNGQPISHSFTICGGYSTVAANNLTNQKSPLQAGTGYLVDYDLITRKFTNWTSYTHPGGKNIVTHFEGISSVEAGVYTLSATSLNGTNLYSSWVSVNRAANQSFDQGTWVDLSYPGVTNFTVFTDDSVYGNNVVGIIEGINGTTNGFSYQATINTGFRRSNLIGANKGNGVSLGGSRSNVIAMNQIGTDPFGSSDTSYGNAENGILITASSAGNMIGGQYGGSNNPTGSEDPTNAVFQRPALGNLISGNHGNGILINNNSSNNTVSGNYIGTDAAGTNALPNWLEGVRIDNANGNGLIGCGVYNNPFVFYNVISGNLGNGVWVNNSTNITIQGNYIGIDAVDTSALGNHNNGIWISGSSKYVQIGGIIPLGSVVAGNFWNGIWVSDTASYVTNFNNFCGVPSFKTYAVPNGLDGMLITSAGGKNTVRTCVISGNAGNGLEIGGNATGVLVEDTTVGTQTDINAPLPNQMNGIVLSGTAHGNTIGGYQPSIETSVHASGNVGYGIAVLDYAYSNTIVNSHIGTGLALTSGQLDPAIPNAQGGIFLDQGTSSTFIGGTKLPRANYIQYNSGDGISIISSAKNSIIGNFVNYNDIGIYATGDCSGTVIRSNNVSSNTYADTVLTGATNIIGH